MSGSFASDFAEQGYAVCPELFSASEVRALCDHVPALLREHHETLDLAADGPPPDPSTDLSDRVLCVQHVHKISAVFRELAADARLTDRLAQLIGPDIKCLQTQLFVKPPGFPGNPWHQDEDPIPTRDKSLVTAWLALDDSTLANGCLRVVPGSHRSGYLYPTRRHEKGDDYDFPVESHGFDETEAQPVEMSAGSVVFFHGYLVHGSQKNVSVGTRRAFTLNCMNAYSPLPLRGGRTDYRDVFVVRGDDPYVWKGYEDRSRPHLRHWPEKDTRPAPPRLAPGTRTAVEEAIQRWDYDEVGAWEMLRQAVAAASGGEPSTRR